MTGRRVGKEGVAVSGSDACPGPQEGHVLTSVGPRPVSAVPAGTMARSRVLLLILLLPPQLRLGLVGTTRSPGFGRSGTHSLSPAENEFVEEGPVLVLRPEEPGPGPVTINCPRDCACSQEGVVDCGGIDLREFPGDLPEHTNHLSLQVRGHHNNGHGAAPYTRGSCPRSPCPQPPARPEPPELVAPQRQTQGARAVPALTPRSQSTMLLQLLCFARGSLG